jgi:hypothetical protein
MLRYVMVAIAVILLIAIVLIIKRYAKLAGRRGVEMGKGDVLGRLLLKKIKRLGKQADSGNPRDLLKQLSRTMRSFFSDYFDIKYEFSEVELNEELAEKGIDGSVREQVLDYTTKMAETEYGKSEITKVEFLFILDKAIGVISLLTGCKDEGVYPELHKEPAVSEKPLPSELFRLPEQEEVPGAPEPVAGRPSLFSKAMSFIRSKVPGPAGRPAEVEKTAAEEELIIPGEEPREEAGSEEPAPPEKPEKPKAKAEERGEKKPSLTDEEVMKIEQRTLEKTDEETRDELNVVKLKRLLIRAEDSLSGKKYDDAMDIYTEMRLIYESLQPEMKKALLNEAKRMIVIYNELLEEYKGALSTERKG